MNGKQIRLATLVAGALWFGGALFVVSGMLLDLDGVSDFGLLLACVGAVMNVRSFVLGLEDRLREDLDGDREHSATVDVLRQRSRGGPHRQ